VQILIKLLCRSYDPQVSYHDQPFYRLSDKLIIRNEKGEAEMMWPGTPISTLRDVQRFDSNRYWNKSDTFHVELGDDEYWCMGDNRLGSKDCRFFGPIKGKFIHGRIRFRIWSLDSDYSWAILDLLQHPLDFWTRVRWNRCLQFVY
jgi:Signal peptidase, peptidase S26